MTDDFIRSSGNLAYVNTWLKLIALALLVLCLALGGALVVKIIDGRSEHVVPIVVNQATGDALAVDYKVVDASGEERSPFEVKKFCEDFLSEAYTFNRLTVRTHLESVARWTAPEALSQVRDSLSLPRRSEMVARNAQGLVEIASFMVTESRPALKVQIYFRTKVFAATGELVEEENLLAVASLKTVRRSARNPHGLVLVEYRQSPFKPVTEE